MEFSLVDLWHEMGLIPKGVMILLVLMSVVSISILAERLFAYSKARAQSAKFAALMNQLLKAGKVEDAAAQAKAKEFAASYVAAVVSTGIDEFRVGGLEHSRKKIEQAIEVESLGLRSGLSILATIASTAPYIGLLGTVFGIINAFKKVGGGGGLDVVGPAIAEALYATAIGLFVAIAAVWAYNYLHSRLEAFALDMGSAMQDILNYFDKRKAA